MPKNADQENLADKLYEHFENIAKQAPKLDNGVNWLLPLAELQETKRVTKIFLDKYYADLNSRRLILGINPGRFGAGVTNVAFTDPVLLESECGIPNSFDKRSELSAVFIYRMINEMGGPATFYKHYFINSVVPFGFVKDGKNYNYYDDRNLQNAMEPFIKYHLEKLLKIGMDSSVCFCLGEGKNYKYLSKLNDREGYFEKIIPLSHPRFIMQYKRKN